MGKEATAYIFSFDSKSGAFTLTSSKDQLTIDSNHKKYEWLKGQEAGRVIKISATGRWTSSKDATGLYDKMLPSKKKSNKRKPQKKKTGLNKAKTTDNKGCARGIAYILVPFSIYLAYNGWEWTAAIIFVLGIFPITFLSEEEEKKELKSQELKKRKAEEKRDAIQVKDFNVKIKKIENNLNKLMSIDCPRPTEFKNNISQREKEIVSKGNPEYLHKFVRISSFLDDLWKYLQNSRNEMRDAFEIKRIKAVYNSRRKEEKKPGYEERLAFERLSSQDFTDYSSEALISKVYEGSEKILKVYPKEIAQLPYLEAMANSMLIFLLEGKQIYFFEILESFDKLGALDSSWQKDVSKKMTSIEAKLDLLILGISNLNDNINRLVEKNDEVLQQLQSIDSNISTNNLIQAITAYQVYKINKNTRRIDA